MKHRALVMGATLAALGTAAPLAKADVEFDTSIGYSHLTLDGSDRFKERDGVRLEPRISFNLPDAEALRLGFGFGISGYSHELNRDTIITVDNGQDVEVFRADQWETVTLLEPEFQISWRQRIADQWSIEPGIGIGAAIANYGIYDDWFWEDEHDSQWDAAFEVRPFLRAGYWSESHGRAWTIGGEVSYMFGSSIDLTDQVHGNVREFYAGGYFGVRW